MKSNLSIFPFTQAKVIWFILITVAISLQISSSGLCEGMLSIESMTISTQEKNGAELKCGPISNVNPTKITDSRHECVNPRDVHYEREVEPQTPSLAVELFSRPLFNPVTFPRSISTNFFSNENLEDEESDDEKIIGTLELVMIGVSVAAIIYTLWAVKQ